MRAERLHLALALILGVAAFVRCVGLDALPPPLNADEASRGYDAWTLLETGADRHGQRWPFFLESYGPGDFSAALSTYLTIPFIALLGPTPVAMRLPDALLSTCTVLLLFVFVRRHLGDRAALGAALILALDPWHIGLTRTAHESGFAPVFLLMGLLGLDRAGLLGDSEATSEPRAGSNPMIAAAIGGLALAMHTWVYPATRLFTPLFAIAIAVIYRRELRRRMQSPAERGVLLSALTALLIGAIPLIATALRQPEQLAARANITLLSSEDGRLQWARNVTANYWQNVSPRDWYWQCDDMTGVLLPGIGRHLIVTAPAFLLGLIVLLGRMRRDRWAQLLIAWLLLFPLPAAICRDWNPHPMRTVAGMALYPIVCAVGLEALVAWINRRRRRASQRIDGSAPLPRAMVAVGAAAILVNAAVIGERYVRIITTDGAVSYQTALINAMRFAARQSPGDQFILVTNRCVQPYIYALLEEPIAPSRLAALERVTVPGRLRFDEVLRLGRYYFAPKEPANAMEAMQRFREIWSAVPADSVGLLIARCEEGGVGELLATFKVGQGGQFQDCYGVWRATRSALSD